MKTKPLLEEEINYNIYNALNLYSEELGQAYITQQFNPFPNSFELTENFVIQRFVNVHTNKELNAPEFILEGITQTKESFTNSKQNCNSTLLEIEKQLANPNTPESLKEELKKLKTYLLCRIQLIDTYLKNIKKDKDTFKMYKNIQSLDWRLAEMFDETYNQQFNTQIAINAYLEFAKQSSALYKKEMANKKLIEKAKQIIKNNQNLEQKTVLQQTAQTEEKQQGPTAMHTQTETQTKIEKQPQKPTQEKPQQHAKAQKNDDREM